MSCQRYEFPWRLLDSLAQLGNGLDTLLKEECSSSYSLSSTYSSTILETAIRTVHPCTQMDIRVLYDTEVGMTHEFIRFGETNFMGVNTTNKVSSYVLKDAGPNQTISLLSSSKNPASQHYQIPDLYRPGATPEAATLRNSSPSCLPVAVLDS